MPNYQPFNPMDNLAQGQAMSLRDRAYQNQVQNDLVQNQLAKRRMAIAENQNYLANRSDARNQEMFDMNKDEMQRKTNLAKANTFYKILSGADASNWGNVYGFAERLTQAGMISPEAMKEVPKVYDKAKVDATTSMFKAIVDNGGKVDQKMTDRMREYSYAINLGQTKKTFPEWIAAEDARKKTPSEKDNRSTMEKEVDFIMRTRKTTWEKALDEWQSTKSQGERIRLYNNEIGILNEDPEFRVLKNENPKAAEDKIRELRELFGIDKITKEKKIDKSGTGIPELPAGFVLDK